MVDDITKRGLYKEMTKGKIAEETEKEICLLINETGREKIPGVAQANLLKNRVICAIMDIGHICENRPGFCKYTCDNCITYLQTYR